jgi:serine/threonine protein kinase/Leucine-rich repeat (LRR) protein
MQTNRICPNCRKPLATGAPLGLCPECLIKSGFPTGTAPGAAEAVGARFVPPPVAEIAALFPQLEILELIGKGGMGAVYKARQPGLGRLVALKVLPPATAGDPGFAERFNREARALAQLNHPNIVAVHDFGRVAAGILPAVEPGVPPGGQAEAISGRRERPEGVPGGRMPPSTSGGTPDATKSVNFLHYLVMEFVDGTNLREVERAGRLSPEQALAIVPQICDALQFAHNEGIVHRDIKPENILLDKKGRVKITDFGIAKIVGANTGQAMLTGAKDVIGTPHYMAPEQVEKPQTVDHRADIYSLGVVFYELLTGELPLGKFQPPSRVGGVQIDVRLDDVVLRTLEKEPERRYQHVSQVKTAVETIAAAPMAAAGSSALAQVKGPAIGLIVTGALDWVLFTIAFVIAGFTARGGPLVWLPLLAMALSGFIIYAGLKLMRLERRGAALLASVLAMFVAPGNLIGLVIGIWALVVLGRPEVKEAMAVSHRPLPRPAKLAFAGTAILLVAAAVRLTADALIIMPERFDLSFPAVQARRQIGNRLSAAGFRWRAVQIDLLRGSSESIWHFPGLTQSGAAGGAPAGGTVRLEPSGSERWLVSGDGALSQIQFDFAAVAGPMPGLVEDDSGLSRVVERVISRKDADEHGFVFFDLETGRSLPPPFPLVTRSNQDLAFVELTDGLDQWIQANRMDVLVHFESNIWSTMNLRMQEDFIAETREWDAVTAQMVSNVFARWDRLDRERPAVPVASRGLAFRDQFEGCKAFRTRSNTMGVMEWEGLETTPASVKIRYRLVLATNPKSAKELVESGRLLYFPADRSLGTIYVRDAGLRWDYPLSWTDWTESTPARGMVTIPAGKDARLDVSPEGAKDLSPLASLAPDDLKCVRFETGRADDLGLKCIGRLAGLKALHATVNHITDAGMVHCAGLTNLLDLHLQGAKITDRSLEVISHFTALEHLCLDFTAITDAGLPHLGKLGSLKDLSVMQTPLTGAGLGHLNLLTNLVALYLCGTGTGDQALQNLPVLPRLERLSLKETKVTDAGLAPLDRFPALRHLDLEKTGVSDAGLAQLSNLKSLEDLLLPDNTTDEGVKRLNGLPALKTLALTRTKATGRCLQFLPHLPSLRTLYLPPEVHDSDLVHLTNFPQLKELWIQGSPVTDRGMPHLAVLRGLKALQLRNVEVIDAGYVVLRELPALERVYLRDRGRTNDFRGGIGDAGLDCVATLAELKHLDLAGSRVTDAGVAKLKGLSNLELLDLSDTCVRGDGLAELRGLSRLRQLRFKNNEVSAAGVDALSGLGSLELLQLQGSKIAPADLLRLQAAVPSTRLRLSEGDSAPGGLMGGNASAPDSTPAVERDHGTHPA